MPDVLDSMSKTVHWHGVLSMRIPSMRAHSSGQWRVTISGKTYYLGSNKEKAKKHYRELICAHFLPDPVNLSSSSTTISELWERFIADQERLVSPRWWDKKRDQLTAVGKPLLELYTDLPVSAFGPKCFHEVRRRYVVSGRSRGYVNSLANKLRQAFRWGVSQELVDHATLQRLETIPPLKPRELGLTDNERVDSVEWERVQQTLGYLSERNADVILLLWETAARPDELLQMREGDIIDGVFKPRSHKTERWNKRRVIPFGARAMEILSRHTPEPGQRYFHWLTDSHTLYQAVQRACKRGKIQPWFPYQLRHAALSRISLAHGKEIATLIAGHSSPQMTDRYDHSGVEKAKRAAG